MAKKLSDTGAATPAPAQLPSKRFIVAASEQGSVGKSFFLTQLAHYLFSHPAAPKVRLYETDEKPTLAHFYPDATHRIDLNEPRQLDEIFVGLAKYDISIVDGMAGHFNHSFLNWGEEVMFFDAAKQIGAEITFVLLVDDNLKYIQESHRILEATPAHVQWLIVANHHNLPLGRKRPLHDWNESPNRRRFLDRGATEIALDRLEDGCRNAMQKFHVPPGEMAATNPLLLNLMDHNRFTKFSRDLYEQFDTCAHLLLPPSMIAQKSESAA